MKTKKILWSYDGSDESKYALKYAVYFAKLFGATVQGLHVNTISYPKYGHYPYYAHFIEDAAKEVDKDFKLRFKCIDNHLASKGIKFSSKIVRGSAGDEISQFIENKKIDLAVMGVTGRGFIGKMLVGSTTQKVFKNSGVPVLAIKKPKEEKPIKINKILVPIDISENFNLSLKSAIELAQKIKCNMTVIYIINVGINFHEFPVDVIDKIISGADVELRKIIDKAKKKFIDNKKDIPMINPKILFGISPGSKIVDYAKKNKFDLIVMNTHAKQTLRGLLLGSVTDHVIRSSNCPVLAMKPR